LKIHLNYVKGNLLKKEKTRGILTRNKLQDKEEIIMKKTLATLFVTSLLSMSAQATELEINKDILTAGAASSGTMSVQLLAEVSDEFSLKVQVPDALAASGLGSVSQVASVNLGSDKLSSDAGCTLDNYIDAFEGATPGSYDMLDTRSIECEQTVDGNDNDIIISIPANLIATVSGANKVVVTLSATGPATPAHGVEALDELSVDIMDSVKSFGHPNTTVDYSDLNEKLMLKYTIPVRGEHAVDTIDMSAIFEVAVAPLS